MEKEHSKKVVLDLLTMINKSKEKNDTQTTLLKMLNDTETDIDFTKLNALLGNSTIAQNLDEELIKNTTARIRLDPKQWYEVRRIVLDDDWKKR